MPRISTQTPNEKGVKTGRRENPAIAGPRDKTVCFMLSEEEKLAVDRLALCLNITRSGLLAKIVVSFVEAAEGRNEANPSTDHLTAFLDECRSATEERGTFAADTITALKETKK